MILLRNKLFSSKKKEAYGDIDEQAPDDPYYNELFRKGGKGAAIAGTGGVAIGSGLIATGGKKGSIAAKRIADLEETIASKEWFKSQAEKNMGTRFEELSKGAIEDYNKVISRSKNEIKDLMKKHGKKVKLNKTGKALAATGATAATLGGLVWAGSKLGDNARKTKKKDLKDVLVQSRKDSK